MTFYISDMDGTLLTPAGTVSQTTTVILNRLMAQGLRFTVATARTPLSALPLLRDIPIRDPMILLNGAVCYDPGSKEFSHAVPMDAAALELLSKAEAAAGIGGMLFTMEDGRFTANLGRVEGCLWDGYFPMDAVAHVDAIDPNIRRRAARELLETQVIYGLYMDNTPERLDVLNACLENCSLTVDYYRDIYSESRWCLEVCSSAAHKGRAVSRLRQEGFSRLVAFGDSRNDSPLFEACDFCCAVENAAPELKQKANLVIGSNAGDGVAQYLERMHGR